MFLSSQRAIAAVIMGRDQSPAQALSCRAQCRRFARVCTVVHRPRYRRRCGHFSIMAMLGLQKVLTAVPELFL